MRLGFNRYIGFNDFLYVIKITEFITLYVYKMNKHIIRSYSRGLN